ncbi:MAG: metallophosphoesterase [Bacteroidetes bacterium]|nr:MAG: metallophosphoesterase [Bacteroidota bacterium]
MKRIALLSDTHGHLDRKNFKYFESCDEIWHAGDIGTLSVCEELEKYKPLRAVYGNIDGQDIRIRYPKDLRFFCEGVDVWITHIGGTPPKYNPDVSPLMRTNPPKLFICGHSHILRVEFDKKHDCLFMNPGAAGVHGFHKKKTLLRFSIEGGRIKDLEAIELGSRA